MLQFAGRSVNERPLLLPNAQAQHESVRDGELRAVVRGAARTDGRHVHEHIDRAVANQFRTACE